MKSLFNTAQQTYCDSLIPTMRERGYSYYVAYSHTYTDSYYRYEPDLYLVFSKQKITANSAYSFTVPQGSIMYSIRTGNYSSNNNAVNTSRVTSQTYGGTFTVDAYEHIYSNAEFAGHTIQPDILAKGVKQNEILNAQSIVVLAFFLFIVFWQMCTFRK